MRAVQTLWTGNKNLLEDGFGWIHPQYNLMSWALSCLSLKEHYEDVVLYTDSEGYKIFHDCLQLPYKEIIVQYDDLDCHRDLWAYPKLLTYSIQDKPFIHIDGDVYLPNRLLLEVESGDLIAQNSEIGTLYYKYMMDAIMKDAISIPNILLDELKKDSISSYNAGVIGGHNLKFIKEYCQQAFDFIDNNHLKNENNKTTNINHNILFEQILFYSLASKQKIKVSTVLDRSINDNGYTYDDFSNFYSFNKNNLMHIIGSHKRNERTCELLSRTLLEKYPKYYKKIIELFPLEHKRLDKNTNRQIPTQIISNLLKNIQSYKDSLDNLSMQWNKIPNKDLLKQEQRSCNYFQFLNDSKEKQTSIVIKKNPYLTIYEIPENWDAHTIDFIRNRIAKNFYANSFDIAYIPSLLNDGYQEVMIDDMHYNILTLLTEDQPLENIFNEINKCFATETKEYQTQIYSSMFTALEYLFYNKLIYI